MAAKDAAIRVQFVEHDVTQVLEKPSPFRVVRQNARMQHIRIRKHYVAAFANRLTCVGGRIAVIGEYAELIVESRGEVVQFGKLILCERLRGEKIERARVAIFEYGIQD